MKIMASSPIALWQIDGETMADFIFLGPKITVDSDWSHEIKRCLLLGRKAITNLDSVIQSRDITLLTKVHIVKGIVFPVVMSWCELDRKVECRRVDVFELWFWRRLESSLDSKEIQPVSHKSNQPWIFFIWTGAEAEAPILWPPDTKSWLIWRDPDAGKDWRQEEKEWQRIRWLDDIPDSVDMSLSKLWETVGQGSLAFCSPWSHKESQTQLSDWTTAVWQELFYVLHVNAFTPHNSFGLLGALMIPFL